MTAALLRQFTDAASATEALALELERVLAEGLAQRGHALLAVSGGRSPVPLFERLSRSTLDWASITVTLVDERWVPPDSADSNEALLRRHLLQGAAAAARFLPLKTDAATPEEAASERGQALSALPLPFDAIVLGMGEDGHTASLFPGAGNLAAGLDPKGGSEFIAIDPPGAAHARLSMTLMTLLRARQLYLSIQGNLKREILATAAELGDPLQLPIAAVVLQQQVPLTIFASP